VYAEFAEETAMLAAATTVAALLIASPSNTDVDRLAANGGFLVGNAHRCGLDNDRVVRAGQLVRELIAAATGDSKEEEAANVRFAEFFIVSALPDQGKDKLTASCKVVSSELAKLEQHRLQLVGSTGEIKSPTPRFRLGDGE
jgi:hypothetical protein